MESDLADVVHDEIGGGLIVRIVTAAVVESKNYKLPKNAKSLLPPSTLYVAMSVNELTEVCQAAVRSFQAQKNLLEIDKSDNLVVVADLHGQVQQLLRIFHHCGPPKQTRYLFLGDYVDRGVQGIELMTLLLCLKTRYPSRVFLLRGNHEDVNTTLSYGFYEECMSRFTERDASGGMIKGEKVWRNFITAFNWMPLAAVVAGRIFCCHGGISPHLDSLQDVNTKIVRPLIVPAYGLATDLLWSDPTTEHQKWANSHRGISFDFGPEKVDEFCARTGIDIVLRGHQVKETMYASGYQLFSNRLVTIFSSVNYENRGNNACVMMISKELELHVITFRLEKKKSKKKGLLSGLSLSRDKSKSGSQEKQGVNTREVKMEASSKMETANGMESDMDTMAEGITPETGQISSPISIPQLSKQLELLEQQKQAAPPPPKEKSSAGKSKENSKQNPERKAERSKNGEKSKPTSGRKTQAHSPTKRHSEPVVCRTPTVPARSKSASAVERGSKTEQRSQNSTDSLSPTMSLTRSVEPSSSVPATTSKSASNQATRTAEEKTREEEEKTQKNTKSTYSSIKPVDK